MIIKNKNYYTTTVPVNFDYDTKISYYDNYKTKEEAVFAGAGNNNYKIKTISNCKELLEYMNYNVVDGFIYQNNERNTENIIGISMLCYDIDTTKQMTPLQKKIFVKRLLILLNKYNYCIASSFRGGLHLCIPIKYYDCSNISIDIKKEVIKFLHSKIAIELGIADYIDKGCTNKGMLIGARVQQSIENDCFLEYQKQQKPLLEVNNYIDSYLLLYENDLLNVVIGTEEKNTYFYWKKCNFCYEKISKDKYDNLLLQLRKTKEIKNNIKINDKVFRSERASIKESDCFSYDKSNDVIYLPSYYFQKQETKTQNNNIELETIDNSIFAIQECTTEWYDFFNKYIKEVICMGSELYKNDFIDCLITMYLNLKARFTQIFTGHQGQGKSLICKLNGMVIEGVVTQEKKFTERFNSLLFDRRCHEFGEFDNWQKCFADIKTFSRNEYLQKEQKFKDAEIIYNNRFVMATTNMLKMNTELETFVRQYSIQRIEGWQQQLKKKIEKVGIKEIAKQYLNYIFSHFDFSKDYIKIDRMDDELLNEISKLNDIGSKVENIYEKHFENDFTYYMNTDDFRKILIDKNIINDCKYIPRLDKLKNIFYEVGYQVIRKRTNKTNMYRIDILNE